MHTPTKRFIALFIFSLVGAAGCGTHGELGTGSFDYVCIDKSDVACTSIGSLALPALIAKGSRARVSFRDSNGSAFPVTPAAPRIASVVNGDIVFHEAGTVALIADKSEEDVEDFTHVSVAVLDHLSLTAVTMGPVKVGQQAAVNAEPIGPSGQSLAGALAYTWTSADPMIASVSSDPKSRTASVTGVAAGTTTITATAAGATGQFTVTVMP